MRWSISVALSVFFASILPRAPDAAASAPPIPLYVFAGQSNMVGACARSGEAPAYRSDSVRLDENVTFWGPTADSPRRWGPLEPSTELLQSFVGPAFGPEVGAAAQLARLRPGRRIAVFKFARNGTDLYSQWNPRNPFGLYQRMRGRLAYARTHFERTYGRRTYIAAFFWMQGEADAMAYHRAAAYRTNLAALLAQMRKDSGNPKLPVAIGRIIDARKLSNDYRWSYAIRSAQYAVAAADPYARLVNTDDLSRDPVSPIHFDAEGTIGLGVRMVGAGI